MMRTADQQTWINGVHGWGQRMQEWYDKMARPLARQERAALRADLDQASVALLQVAAALEKEWTVANTSTSTLGLSLLWPIEGREPSAEQISPSGWSQDHLDRGEREALDIAVFTGTSLVWPHAGVLKQTGWLGDCGYAVTEEWDGDGHHYLLRLCHLRETPGYAPGTLLSARDLAGYSGASGKVTGPHLHIFLEQDGVRLRLEDIYGIA